MPAPAKFLNEQEQNKSDSAALSAATTPDKSEYLKIGLRICRNIAKATHSKIAAGHLEVEDFEQYGAFGLLDAINGFEPERGFSFQTYAVPRIAGAIIDGLRNESLNSRQTVSQNKVLESIFDALNSEDISLSVRGMEAENLGLDRNQVAELLKTNGLLNQTSLDSLGLTEERDGEFRVKPNIPSDEKSPSPQRNLDNHEFLKMALKGLNKFQRLVVIEYFYLGHSMKEIAANLNYSESRVSQTLIPVLLHVANNLRHYYGDQPLGPLRPDLDTASRTGRRSTEEVLKANGNTAAGGTLTDLSFDFSE